MLINKFPVPLNMDEISVVAEKAPKHIDNINKLMIEEALRIRLVEEAFLQLFSEGRMNGTVHTCIGQEFSAVTVCNLLKQCDWVTSNHRCHGHFIAKTGNWKGLIDELLGLKSGVCGGIGSSQHLYEKGFLSNGVQGSLLPVGTGLALHKKLSESEGIIVSFLGEGTLGEGVLYESLNLASLYDVPQLFICENNFYSQSTPQGNSIAGSITKRADSFGIKTFDCNTWESTDLLEVMRGAIKYSRKGHPAFVNIQTYRLNAHSKGDDDRDQSEIDYFKSLDPLNLLLKSEFWSKKREKIKQEIDDYIQDILKIKMQKEEYCFDQLPRKKDYSLIEVKNEKTRMVQALNRAYSESLSAGSFFIGEDIVDPYGGAFKVTKGFSSKYPNQVLTSSISEAGMVGVSIGMALMGTQSYTEIMFGDFATLAFDQLLNNASKMHHMYNFQVDVPLRIRTPMGGKRGYGPTHSQSLEKFFVGIDNVLTIAMSSLHNPVSSIRELSNIQCPAFIVENKLDYGKILWQGNALYKLYKQDKPFGGLILTPNDYDPDITLVSYGETARHIADNLNYLFEETDKFAELICLTMLHPMDLSLVESSINKTEKLIVIEDGSVNFGIGSEVLSKILEGGKKLKYARRIGSKPYPIPSTSELELEVLPTIKSIIKEIIMLNKKDHHD